jgi:hypothetical protein
MLQTAEKWQPQAKRSYFIQLPGGKYGLLAEHGISNDRARGRNEPALHSRGPHGPSGGGQGIS